MKIAVLGAESTGKSTLCYAMATALGATGAPASVVDEYLREWCLNAQRTPRPDEQAAIACEQSRRIHAQAGSTIIADTTALMTAVYSDVLFQDISLYPMAWQDLCHFSHVLVTATDLPWVADSYLRDSPGGQQAIHQRLQQVLREQCVSYSMVYGQGDQRVRAALTAVMPAPTESDAELLTYRRWMSQCEKCSDAACEHRMFQPFTAP